MEEILGNGTFLIIIIGILALSISAVLFFLHKRGTSTDLFSYLDEENKNNNEVETLEITDEIQKNEILEKEASFEDSNELDDLMKTMELDIIAREETDVEAFEFAQEERSIISYTELLDKARANLPKEEPILNSKIKMTKIPSLGPKEEQIKPKSDFISPVYGRLENKGSYPTIKAPHEELSERIRSGEISLDETLSLEKLNEEIQKNAEFLNMLKDFRNNLE